MTEKQISEGPIGFFSFRLHYPFLTGSFVLSIVIYLLYSVAFGHNFFFDEENIILKNPLIRDLSQFAEIFKQPYFYEGLPKIFWQQYYRPLTTLTFAVDYRLWNVNPFGYNLTNTLLQCGVCVLLFKLLSMMLKDTLAAFLSVLVFSVHTIHTEAVTYIASRGDVLGGLLILGACFLYWRSKILWALLAHTLALFAKESAILLPLYLLTLDRAFIKSDWRRLLRKLLPFILITVLFLAFRKFLCPVPMGPPTNGLKEAALRVLSMGPPFLSYLQTVLMPEVFTFSLAVNFAKSFFEPKIFVSIFIVFLMLCAWVLAARRRGAAFFGMTVFLISFLPYLQVIHFYPEWAEHYLYMPAIGLTVLLGSLVKTIRGLRSRIAFVIFLIIYIPFVSFLSYRTYQRNKIYNDTEAYFGYLAKSGARYAHFGYQNLGRLALDNGKYEEAIVLIKTAEKINPRSDVTQNLLGIYYMQKGKLEESLKHFNLAYQYDRMNQVYRINASYILMRLERYKEVVQILEEVQKIVPGYSSVYINLVNAYELLGNIEAAKQWSKKGLQLTQASEWERASLLMTVIRMEYRQGWDEEARTHVTEIADKYSKIFWLSDVARLILGKITPEHFSSLLKTRYFGFDNMAHGFVLIAYVMQGQREEADKYLEDNKESFEEQAAKQPLLRKEIERVQKKIRNSKIKVMV
ncbi:MAG: hypothetical protein AUJ72_03515 [Candidatus Omnitrophica bacterium CG1_02_46_14]|nr:MAG: hypothetical protein AUJ72_03515 [Candidatus Omnitrophica bacterium CG1_02_46_14]